MSAVPITINGIQTDETGSRNVTIVGMASLTGLGVGGGPVMPPSGAHPEHPIYWPPGSQPHPEHPIVLPPQPPGDAHPEHPIVLPPEQGGGEPPAASWVWGWNMSQGWHPVYVPPPGAQTPH